MSNCLELSVESLLDDVLFDVVEGDRAYAFDRRAFELEMQSLQPAQSDQTPQNASESASESISKSTSKSTDSHVAV